MKTGIRFFRFILIVFILSLTTGCFDIGPRVLPGNRVAYNRSLQSSEAEQLLLNLVRMRYDEAPYFLGVSSVSATMRVGTNLAGEYQNTVGGGFPAIDQLTAAGDVTYEDRPVITYSPMQGTQFSHEILIPMPVAHVDMLIDSGWSAERVMRIMTHRVSNITNVLTVRPSAVENQNFAAFAYYLNKLNHEGVIDVRGGLYHKTNSLEIAILNPQGHTAEIRRLYAMLNVRGMPNRIELVPPEVTILSPSPTAVSFQTRSFMGVMYYLSKGVEVTPAEIQKGIVVVPQNQRGSENGLTRGIISVKSSGIKPTNAFIAVFYRHRWFYILDSDDDSKKTLSLLEQLYNLQSGDKMTDQQAPVLTLPV